MPEGVIDVTGRGLRAIGAGLRRPPGPGDEHAASGRGTVASGALAGAGARLRGQLQSAPLLVDARRAIFERLELALSRAGASSQVATLFVDLDGLKMLNDSLGHDRADDIIREIAQRLRPVMRAQPLGAD